MNSKRLRFSFFCGLVCASLPWPAAASPVMDPAHSVPLEKGAKWTASSLKALKDRGTPFTATSWDSQKYIGMPVGGIGCGTVYVGGDGRLWCWDIFNAVHEGCVPNKTQFENSELFGGKYQERNGANYVAPVEMTSPWNLDQELSVKIANRVWPIGKEGFSKISFIGKYPIGTVTFSDSSCPVSVSMETYSPFIPLNLDDSSLPCAIREVTFKNPGSTPVVLTLSAELENGAYKLYEPKEKVPEKAPEKEAAVLVRKADALPLPSGALVQGRGFLKPERTGDAFASRGDAGTIALAMLGAQSKSDPVPDAVFPDKQIMTVRQEITVPAGGEAKAVVIYAWHFPAIHPRLHKFPDPKRWYTEKFSDAAAVATYVAQEHARLSGQTRLFRDTWYGAETGPNQGTLPHWLLERSLWTISALNTAGSYRLTNKRFWGWEGTGACEGTCMHVWHYGQAMGRLFPELEIQLRENTDFTPAVMKENGAIGYRGIFGLHPSIDGQSGLLLRCYREHLNDPTGEFLKRNWSNIKRATEYLIEVEATGKSGNDGVFSARLVNTLDAKWGGQVPWLVGMYLAGLQASAAMADAQGDGEFAQACRVIIAKGQAAYDGYFNPEYGYYTAQFEPKQLLPVHIGKGCHIDMCLGDFWLAQVGLPALGSPEKLRTSMESLFRYNFVPDVGRFRESIQPVRDRGRFYAGAGDAGLVMATWPFEQLPAEAKKPIYFMYFQECMSGFEHAAAALMVSLAKDQNDPMLLQGLAVQRAIHDRYSADKRNPYNEIECSDHYARAMASYGVFIAATGFHCDASQGLVRFLPKLDPADFATPFVGAGAWGRFEQHHLANRHTAKLEVRHGALRLAQLGMIPPKEINPARIRAKVGGKAVPCRATLEKGQLRVLLENPVVLNAGSSLEVDTD